jgi:DNA-binding phage protein
MTRKKSRPYKIGLHERLRDSKHAISYINAALAQDSTEGFLMALRDVVEAMQGMSALAEDASVNRENLYRTWIRREDGHFPLPSKGVRAAILARMPSANRWMRGDSVRRSVGRLCGRVSSAGRRNSLKRSFCKV